MAKVIKWQDKIILDKDIDYDKYENEVHCVNCQLAIGHPSILRMTNYECPKCGYKYKG